MVRSYFCIFVLLCGLFPGAASGAEVSPLRFGFSKLDVTPKEPLRLAGYPGRKNVSHGVASKIFVRVLVLEASDSKRSVLASIDAYGLPGTWTVDMIQQIERKFGIPRSRVVLNATGTHSAPQLTGGPNNLLREPLTAEQSARTAAYTKWLSEQVLVAIQVAVEDLAPGSLRVAKDANAADGVRSASLLVIRGAKDDLRGIVFQESRPANILPEAFNEIASDWPGFAQAKLENAHPGMIALAILGCTDIADMEEGSLETAKRLGESVAAKIEQAMSDDDNEVTSPPSYSFGYAGLAPVRPDAAELTKKLLDRDIHVRRHAATMLKILSRMGRLPESYPCPVHVWRFGDELAMVFVGGVVVSDYYNRLADEIDTENLWVSSLADDAFGIVTAKDTAIDPTIEATARYFDVPGPWEAETENVLASRVVDLWRNPVAEEALSPAEALTTFRLSPGFEIELVAAEPLVRDPINMAFGPDGRLWVVEMGDYPRGVDGNGKPGGQILVLEDIDHDGTFDKSTPFLEGLEFPTGVMPWRKGALVCGAPEIFYVEDTDGDGKGDKRELLFEGFSRRNPQHRANGFAYGLDNWIYVAANSDGEVRSTKTGKVINLSGRDCRIRPDTGEIEAVNGHSQFIRDRDDFGHWFGNENWCPLWHYLFPDRYSGRNAFIAGPDPWVATTEDFRYPPVYPASRTVDRFNDLFTANRFTSACSPTIYRDELLWNRDAMMALVCEPVHNLVHRLELHADGLNFKSQRAPVELSSEFVASTDTWFRPTRVTTGPDGAIWIADMYRHVIEHPEWIPETWQARLDVRAGADKGRIYRVFPKGKRPASFPKLAGLSGEELVLKLASPNGWVRDTAQRLIVAAGDRSVARPLAELARSASLPQARIQALCTLEGLNSLESASLLLAMRDEHPLVRAWGVQLAEPVISADRDIDVEFAGALDKLAGDQDLRVRFQLALSLGEWKNSKAGSLLGQIAVSDFKDAWMRAAVLSSAGHAPEQILAKVLGDVVAGDDRDEMVQQLIATTVGLHGDAGLSRILTVITPAASAAVEPWQIAALGGVADAIERDKLDLASVAAKAKPSSLLPRIERVFAKARLLVVDAEVAIPERAAAIRLTGRLPSAPAEEIAVLGDFLKPQAPPELRAAALATLARRKDKQASTILLAGWRGYVPSLRGEVLDLLLSRPEWTTALLDSLATATIPIEHIDATRRDRLLGLKDDAQREKAITLLASQRPESRRSVVEAFRSATALPGNALRGATRFQKTCAGCHLFRGRGVALGANLSILQDKSSAALLDAVLDPNKAVEAKFVNYLATTTDGRVLSGLIVAENASSITLAQADGKQEVILRVDLEELAGAGKSFMPEGLEKDLTHQDLADIFAYVQSQPIEIDSATDAQQSAARDQWAESGRNGIARILGAPPATSSESWLGKQTLFLCDGSSANARKLSWESEPAPAEISPNEKYAFHIPVALGNLAGEANSFQLSIGGAASIAFAPDGKDASWQSKDGRISLSFLLMEVGENLARGVLEVEVPGSLLTSKEPLQLSLETERNDGCRWLGLLTPAE